MAAQLGWHLMTVACSQTSCSSFQSLQHSAITVGSRKRNSQCQLWEILSACHNAVLNEQMIRIHSHIESFRTINTRCVCVCECVRVCSENIDRGQTKLECVFKWFCLYELEQNLLQTGLVKRNAVGGSKKDVLLTVHLDSLIWNPCPSLAISTKCKHVDNEMQKKTS